MRYKIDNDKSMIHWRGSENNGNGTVHLKRGEIITENDKIAGGRLVIDMRTIEMDRKEHERSLRSEANLDIDNSPEAAIQIVSVLSNPDVGDMPKESDQPDQFIPKYRLEGEVTIQNTTKRVILPADIEVKDGRIEAHSRFRLDRQEWVNDLLNETSGNSVPQVEIVMDLFAYSDGEER